MKYAVVIFPVEVTRCIRRC